jgi:hypothetical protein
MKTNKEVAMSQKFGSHWDEHTQIFTVRLNGAVMVADVRKWKDGVQAELAKIPDGTAFKIIINFYGYEMAEIDAHKEMRNFMPLLLADYGFRTALLDLFDPIDLPLQKTRGIQCVAVAHIHHDAGKMNEYDRRLGRANERFFTDAVAAEAWILNLEFSTQTT